MTDVMDAGDDVPIIANLPMGGGAVRGPGAGALHVRWGLGNELRVSRARAPATDDAADEEGEGARVVGAMDADAPSQGAAYVVQWCV